MLAIKGVPAAVVSVVEARLEEDLVASAASASQTGIADILNRLEKSQSEAVLQSLAKVRPEEAKALKSLLFTFEDLAALPQPTRTSVLDQVPIERLVLAMKGTEPTFQAAMLSALPSRSRRMVEAELQGGGAAPARDVAEARRGVVDVVLKMIAKGDIELQTSDDLSEIAS
jgi:flagellar motor switch protein FliG